MSSDGDRFKLTGYFLAKAAPLAEILSNIIQTDLRGGEEGYSSDDLQQMYSEENPGDYFSVVFRIGNDIRILVKRSTPTRTYKNKVYILAAPQEFDGRFLQGTAYFKLGAEGLIDMHVELSKAMSGAYAQIFFSSGDSQGELTVQATPEKPTMCNALPLGADDDDLFYQG